ncbi:[protein-PII] uridylyltransferase family protein [Jannaschia marina]|uniref:[protein-PII] uridylyltransferase family protein n=1 Tax=Jannaschia marina TaxID=2741674 RepID=UPI0015CAF97E|nr:glutamine-synthetase adenylyltransferase [Jannaschia marina]
MFRSRITRPPIAFDPEAGHTAVRSVAPPADAADLVAGAAGCSPFLGGLMTRERDWLAGVWDREPERSLRELLDGVAAIEGDPKVELRRAKRRAALLVGLAEIGGVWPVMEATAAWTEFADAVLQRALDWGLARHGRAPVAGDGGLVALAMGKMGAHELNYSSDIDLVLLFDESRYDPGDYGQARAALLKVARTAMAALSDITGEGYVFRTDLRLRPDPGSTPIVMSMEAAERYYEAMGRTWERAAWIKARAAAGDVAAGVGFLGRLAPFVWRRHLDFAVVEEAFDMRRRIRDHKGLAGAWDVPGHDLKLGQGGIREIEFLTQTQQIIAGGRDATLRVRGTLKGLDRLVDAGWVAGADRGVLAREYRHLRSVEHRVQMVQDAQTHRLPKDAEGLRRIACFMGEADGGAFVDDLRERMRAVEAITDPSFRPPETAQAATEITGAAAVTDRWASYPALRTGRAREIFARLRPGLLAALARAARPEEALAAFDGFLRGLPAGVQVFSLFEANPKLVELLADICATAPDLAAYLSRNAGVFDAVIGGDFFAPLPSVWPLPRVTGDFEMHLGVLRRWHREAHFRVGVHLLRGLVGPDEAGAAYAGLARAVLTAAWVAAEHETVRRYGLVPGLRLAGLGMGSLGAGSLTARSDLDLVVLHDGAEPGAASDGRRSLGAGQWAAKFTQVLITALSAQTGEGRLYEVDMRLRPSGRQGPVATPLSGFRSYQAQEAWVWEHLALTRARAIVGDAQVCAAAEDVRCAVIRESRFARTEVLAQLADMRARLEGAGRSGAGLSVKSGPGRVQDIELAAQAHALLAGSEAREVAAQLAVPGWLPEGVRATLTEAHATLSAVRQVGQLLTPADPPGDLGAGGAALLARTLGVADEVAVAAACDAAAERAAAAIASALDGSGGAG